MNRIESSIERLFKAQRRYEKFKELFQQFQRNFALLQGDRFPIKGIEFDHNDGESSNLHFLGRDYSIEFTMIYVGDALKGKLTFNRCLDDQASRCLHSVTFDGQGELDVAPPAGDDTLYIDEDSSCLVLLLDWMSSEIYS
ncbi:hypothetical protein MARLIPOL_15744 [Marinobacter lipolyticus SM19]|uniref:Uncharacterized protein n=1 Tax=Marinobacter lipolyticus SM19 TaxID=1318628 RepID=R8AWZ5_9GAMM|nr:hypothetical protein [Marinobacter lipolyticus]EON90846.1 hypothetical protein MARLIPOL_15744 [Marinobacter lipolyticus SM19]